MTLQNMQYNKLKYLNKVFEKFIFKIIFMQEVLRKNTITDK